MKNAIVTLAVGEKHKSLFEKHCRSNWQEYCDKCGYDLIVITEAFDSSDRARARSISWQKLLILSQKWATNYQQIIWIDSDVIINPNVAFDIIKKVPIETVGGVDQYAIPTKEIFDISLSRLYNDWTRSGVAYLDNRTPESYYLNRGIPGHGLQHVMQGGIFVCSPLHHKELFERIYYNYEDSSGGGNFENPALSYELVKEDLVTWLPSQFNFCVINIISAFYPELFGTKPGFFKSCLSKVVRKIFSIEFKQKPNKAELICLKNIYDLSAFMHFASCINLMPHVGDFIKC